MPEFLELIAPDIALAKLINALNLPVDAEEVSVENALGRVTTRPIIAPHPLPPFSRSTVDGYAVRAVATFGAGESLPVYLSIIGEVDMGAAPVFKLTSMECALIHTGGMLPTGADAVVMLENTQLSRDREVEILRAAAVGENVIKAGEDVSEGEEVIPTQTRIRPTEIGGLMALGITKLLVAKKPRVAIISSGDEIVAPDDVLRPGCVRDVNSYSLSAMVEEAGGLPARYGIVPDNFNSLFEAASKALSDCNFVVITAGSSASTRDLTSQVINQLGDPGVLVHGVNIRPGRPTILAVCKGKPVVGLPGNPVSALVIAGLFVAPIVRSLLGIRRESFRPAVRARLNVNLASQAGREDWVAVRLLRTEDGILADPVFGKSNLIFTLVRADGLVRIPPETTGLNFDEIVDVQLI